MTEITDTLHQVLKQHGFSLTKPRTIVFNALQNEEPQTMREVVAKCSAIDRASVYRVISLFEQLGVVQRLQMGWKYRLELSDDFHEHHHHLRCTRCNSVTPLQEDLDLEERLNVIAQNYKFTLQNHQLELSGLCEACSRS